MPAKLPTHCRDHCAKKQSMIDEDRSLHDCCKLFQSLGGNVAVDQTREHLNRTLQLNPKILNCMQFFEGMKYINLNIYTSIKSDLQRGDK